MTSNLNVCLYPMNLSWGDKQHNLETLKRDIRLVHHETDLLVVPEMFSTGFMTSDKEQIRSLAEKNSGETIELIKQLAKENNLAIAGSFIAETGGLIYNRGFFVEPSGDVVFADKRHLFSIGGEDKVFAAGDSRLHIRFRGWNLSMIICYDLRFPVWCRNKDNGYDLLIAVANWPRPRIDTWNHLLKARAMENLAYVCGVNCCGTDLDNREYDGSSLVFDFKGKDLTVESPDSPFKYASLSLSALEQFRTKFPAWKDADSFNINL